MGKGIYSINTNANAKKIFIMNFGENKLERL